MRRNRIEPREGWRRKVEALGMMFHSTEAPYWDESVFYSFTLAQVLEIERATNELFALCCEAVKHVIGTGLWEEFKIPRAAIPMIRRSWEEDDVSLYGRFDLRYDGNGTPKMYEFNADTPTSLLETAVVQWHWLRERYPACDQFNSIHEKLVAHWQIAEVKGPVHFACAAGSDEEFATTVYLEDTARQAGIKTSRLFIQEIGWDGRGFVDLDNQRIRTLFKLYPWEWMLREPFGQYLYREPAQLIEPAWKMILSNKRLLPLLWELFPGHPNLLPAYMQAEPLGNSYVKKPLFGRGGVDITLRAGANEVTSDGRAEVEEGYVYQALSLPPALDGAFPVIGSWIIGGTAAGMGIREAASPVTNEKSRFVPHLIQAG
ncbi:MAG: glutathionylspermidine synthase family protein [Verrucomicrobiota bacterium]